MKQKKQILPKIWQRTPISYYGGKQSMLPKLLSMVPNHTTYVEPFFGGGALFWAKKPAKVEIVNDFNANVYNFYKVLKNDFAALKKLVESSLHSRDTYKCALVMYHTPFVFTPVQRAWAFWYATNVGFSNMIGNYRYDKSGKAESLLARKRIAFTDEYSRRLEWTQIENADACQVIRSRDNLEAFIYCDPPYIGADQGHYAGYSQENFNELLQTLSEIKGKFLLSSYPNDELTKYVKRNDWQQVELVQSLNSSNTKGKKKTEVLTFNYNL